jgi:PKD repeat protein
MQHPSGIGWEIFTTASGCIEFYAANDNIMGHHLYVQSNIALSDYEWHHVVVTLDGSSNASGVHIYLDGEDVPLTVLDDGLRASIYTNDHFRVGTEVSQPGYFQGKIDEVVLYDKTLNQSEVNYRYNNGNGREDFYYGTPLNQPPVANFTFTPENPTTNDVIQFTDTSYDTDGYLMNWTWNFDDGTVSYLQNPTHQYQDHRTYNVALMVTDNNGSTDTISKPVIVRNREPITNFMYNPSNPTNIDMIQFTDTSIDLDGTIVSWFWNFGNGNTSTLQNPTYRYIHGGTYTVMLTVTDDDGSQNTMNTTIIVTTVNHPPNTPTTPSGSIKGIAGIEYAYSAQTTDPDGDFIKYGWDWNGDFIVDTWTSLMPSGVILNIHHLWSDIGSYTIRVKAKDKYGLESNWSDPLTVRMYLLGDVNGDDTMDFGDINPFVLALTAGESGYYNAYPNGYYYTADINLDGQVNFGDINPFVALLTKAK